MAAPLPRLVAGGRPVAYQDRDIYLRTAVSVARKGGPISTTSRCPITGGGSSWPTPSRANGRLRGPSGRPVWQEVPGEMRAELRRLVVVQGDTEPASVEQQRHLCDTAPSLYDLRNLFQVNVEEGRHLWAMVYLLHRFFGRDGREEADELLVRHSGDIDKPRILGAFNEPTPDWLSFFMFTYFTDRDGKFQLASLRRERFRPPGAHLPVHAERGGPPHVRRCRRRRPRGAAHGRAHAQHDTDDVAPFGGINVETLQRYLNLHYSVSLDLFGAETSTNAANYFAAGLKGRFERAPPRRPPAPRPRRSLCRARPAPSATDRAGPFRPQQHPSERLHRRLPERP